MRAYPAGQAFRGTSFGVKAGLTSIPRHGSYVGFGFDLNQSWMVSDHAYIGLGAGLKRLVGTDERDFSLKYIPTARINVGVGF